MNRNYFLWIVLITLLCVFLIFYSMWQTVKPPAPPPEILTNRPLPPFKSYISGVGVVEASSDNIAIGTPLNRVVEKVLVVVGQQVKKNEVLFKLEDQDLQAELASRQADYEIAKAKLKRMEDLPRHEDLVAAEAGLKIAQVELNQTQDQYNRVKGLEDTRAMSLEQINRQRFSFEQAQARWQEALANLNKIKAGTWKPDLTIASLEVQQAKTNVERIQAEIQRTMIRSPIDGKVLQIKIHEGEYPLTVSASNPLMIVGNTNEMYLKVSINQFDTPYFRSDAPAVAFLRGDARIEFPLEFVRLEPFLVNKQNLTNEITEVVDTRVLQVIYLIKQKAHNIFVGQQMDVFIEAEFPS